VGCEDGGEPHARALAARIDEKVRQIAPEAGAPGEARLILMAALMVADELNEAEAAIRAAEARAADYEKSLDRLASKAVAALEAAADRLDDMAPESPANPTLLL
ncbi:MAG TPA: cell division protein ZapA, partial [Caulobacteraceae bacterium]|nr:cell division protein ZapA [Caulobacteraceae bacterium]